MLSEGLGCVVLRSPRRAADLQASEDNFNDKVKVPLCRVMVLTLPRTGCGLKLPMYIV